MKMPPLQLVLNSGSESRREFADLSITAGFNDQAKVEAESVYKAIRAATVERRYSDPEDLAVALAHRLLDSETGVTSVEVEIAANSWRRLGASAFERGSAEVRLARASVGRDGSASVGAALRGLKLMMGEPCFETVHMEWRYKSAGVSYNSAWSAVRKLVLQAFDDREEPQAIAQLLVDVIESLAEVKMTVEREALIQTGHPGLFEASGVVKRHSVTAKSR